MELSRSIFLRGVAAAVAVAGEVAGSAPAAVNAAPAPRGPGSVEILTNGSADVTTPLRAQQPFTLGMHFRMQPDQPDSFELISSRHFAMGVRLGDLRVDGLCSVWSPSGTILLYRGAAAPSPSIGPGKDWHYLALVFAADAEPQMRVYCDGAYVLSYGQKEAPIALTEPNRWSIGGRSALPRPFETVQPAHFDLGSLRFWSEARTAQQVATDASTFEPGDQPPSASVASEWLVADTEPPVYWSRAPYQTVSLNGSVHHNDPARTGTLWDVARKIAPIVFFHPSERHFPSSIEWFLQRTDLVRGSGTLTYGDGTVGLSRLPRGMDVIKRGPLAVDDLLQASSQNPEISNNQVSLWPSAPDPVSGFPFSPTQHTTLYGEPLVNKLSPAKCYCRVTQDQTYSFEEYQYYYFTYYFFYPYNGGIGPKALISDDAGPMDGLSSGWVAHIGDWERVVARVVLNPRKNLWVTGSYAMEWHGNDEWTFFYQGLVEKLHFWELHPFVVYSSWHSHASHTSVRENWPTDTSIADDRTGEGARWNTGDKLVFLNDQEAPWINYNGLWGANMRVRGWGSLFGADGLKGGPEGPKQHSSWSRRSSETGATVPLRAALGPI